MDKDLLEFLYTAVRHTLLPIATGLVGVFIFYKLNPELCRDLVLYWLRPWRKSDNAMVWAQPLVPLVWLTILYLSVGCILLGIYSKPHTGSGGIIVLTQYPKQLAVLILAGLAVFEEIKYRGLPLIAGWIAQKFLRVDLQHPLGLVSSVLFALAHLVNYGNPVDTGNIVFVLPQFVLGLLIWYAAKKSGFHMGIMLHLMVNTPLQLLPLLLGR